MILLPNISGFSVTLARAATPVLATAYPAPMQDPVTAIAMARNCCPRATVAPTSSASAARPMDVICNIPTHTTNNMSIINLLFNPLSLPKLGLILFSSSTIKFFALYMYGEGRFMLNALGAINFGGGELEVESEILFRC